MTNIFKNKIGQILVGKGIVNEEVLQQALIFQRDEPAAARRKIGDILIEEFGVDRDLIYTEISKTYGFSKLNLNGLASDKKQLEFIRNLIGKLEKENRDVLARHHFLPYKTVSANNNALIIIAADPTDILIPEIVLHLGYSKYDVVYMPLEEIGILVAELIPEQNEFLQILNEMSTGDEFKTCSEDAVDEEVIDAEINQSKLTNLVEGALLEAVRKGVSDIHIVPKKQNRVEFLFRIDGRLMQWHIQENTRPESISAVFKDRAKNVDRFDRESAQDGFIQRFIDEHNIRFRISILPVIGTEYNKKLESIVIRVLDDRNVITDMEELGFQDQTKSDFLNSISRSQGMVILTGPTGSGKSTTLVAALHHVADPSLNVLTVEDPVEYVIEDVRQLKIGNKMNFDQAMRSILRHDPDIVMVGEIRDLKTAEIAVKLANTGHLTFTTLHTNDAPSAISRLYKMGIEPFLIANSTNIVVAQRLVRTLCPECKVRLDKYDASVIDLLGFTENEIQKTIFYRPVGCGECQNGFKGRAAIHEALLFTKDIRQMIVKARDNIDEEELRKKAVENGMRTLRMSGKERIKQGLTTCEEVIYATVED